MKRIVSLVLALSMVLSLFTTAFAGTSLTDVEGTKYEAAVSALVELGVVNGYEDNTYRAEKVVTRAEMAKLLVIASGLEAAADLNKGATRFNDVAANHWATGYINVATEYGYVSGYPDGSFAPDATVTYAEAVTMAIRVLGYKSVVESKGTWPTNYIAKASELKALKDVDYKTYGDGATRGNVAILVWNILRAPIWDVESENEKDGLNYAASDTTMIDKYFDDYAYVTTTFEGFEIDDDGKVQVTLDDEDEDSKKILGTAEYEYDATDFYKFVEGTEVEVLVNEEDKTLLTMVATEDNTLKDGSKDVIDDDYTELVGNDYDYAYVRTSKKAIKDATVLSTKSIFVDKLEKKSDYIKINSGKFGIDGNKYTNDLVSEKTDFDSEVIIKNGERVSLSDIELGDILTAVTVKTLDEGRLSKVATFYVIGSEEAEGELTRCAEVKYENNSSISFTQMTVGKKKYVVDTNATYVEDPDAKTVKAVELAGNYKEEMEGEVVALRLDVVTGKVVRVEFDGNIDSGSDEDTSIKFFGVVDSVDKDGKVYSIELEDESGKETYEFAKNSDAENDAKVIYSDGTDLTGAFIYVELNDEDKIVKFDGVAGYDSENDNAPKAKITPIPYGESSDDAYYVMDLNTATYDEDTTAVVDDSSADNKIKVNSDTVLVKVIYDNKGTDKSSDDEYRVEFEEGLSEIKKAVKSKVTIAIYDAAETFTRAKYIVIFDDTSDKSDNRIAKVVTPDEGTIYIGGKMIDLEENDGTETSIKLAAETRDLSNYELVVYTVTTNSKGTETFNYVAGLTSDELTSDNVAHGYVGACDSTGRVFKLEDSEEIDLADYEDDYEDYMIILVNTNELDEEGTFEVSSYDEMTYDEVELEEGDRFSIDTKAEVIFIIRGMGIKA